ncbi:MAG: hypothetical protein PW786_06095 [Arachidicoccus sp.]|nr:hypothetical protein [Arachidicoccus sp.]
MRFLIIHFLFFVSFLSVCNAANFHAVCYQDTLPAKHDSSEISKTNTNLLSQKMLSKTDERQQANFDTVFKPFKSFIKHTSIESTTNLTIKEQKISYKTVADFITKYTLNGVASGKRIFNVSIVKLNTKVETMGLQLQYNSDSVQADTTSSFAKPLFDIVGKNIRVDIDTAGKILSVDTSEVNANINTVLSSLYVNGESFKIGENFGLLYNKNTDNFQLGYVWTNSSENENGKTISKYTVQSLLHNEIILLVQGEIIQNGTFWNNGHVFNTNFTGSHSGKVIIAKDSKLIKQKITVYNLHGTIHYSDGDLPAAAVSRIIENLNPS